MRAFLVLICVFVSAAFSGSLSASSTFSYQGRLQAVGELFSGTVDMEFALYAASGGGLGLASVAHAGVVVVEGLFQVDLNFGEQTYEEELWLEITVNGQLLTPRQPLRASPASLRAVSAVSAQALGGDCPSPTGAPDDEMVRVGGLCIDRYEASLWDAPIGGNQIVGTVPCNANGQDCNNIYARSVAGVQPRAVITWFQAQRALANSGKRLLSSAEWQMAVAGTPDGPPCNVLSAGPVVTGSSGCESAFGVHDMVGNVWEWVSDWVPRSTHCPGWGAFSDDLMCLSGASTTAQGPGSIIRGGDWVNGAVNGPLTISGDWPPTAAAVWIGFRGVR